MVSYAMVHVDDIDELPDGRCLYRPVRLHFGIRSFGVVAWTAHAPGDRVIGDHEDAGAKTDEELFLVMSGRAVFEIAGDRVDAPTGTFVFAPPGVERTAFAQEAGTTILALDATAGEAYEPRGWELWSPLFPLYEAGQYGEVADRLRAVVDTPPQYALLFYNLACCESLTGRTGDALGHLAHAIELSERYREAARGDSDLDPIRDEPEFQQLVRGGPDP
jgi:mannose-6-phosphate isomerase-like protein (cupin superfamily)